VLYIPGGGELKNIMIGSVYVSFFEDFIWSEMGEE
jgi:hypothetical protein